MKKKKINISLYIIIPSIFTGITLIAVLATYQITQYYVKVGSVDAWPLRLWGVAIVIITFLIGLVIIRVILKPIKKFIQEMEQLPLYKVNESKEKRSDGEDQNVEEINTPAKEDDIEQYSRVFHKVTNILGTVEAKEHFPRIIGHSKPMREIFSQILKVAPTNTSVLITGESGTGKELVATSVYEHSKRKNKPFIKLNCVAVPEGLLESELFGHEKGAFTGAISRKKGKFELADGGTLFLDEIGDMPLSTQGKILRVLQEREVERVGGTELIKIDVRFIAATNKNFKEMVKNGEFREDLYYRLNVFPINIPSLRRREDIIMLANYFLSQSQKDSTLSKEAEEMLSRYPWPGNVRELKNIIERAVVMSDDKTIHSFHLPDQFHNTQPLGNTNGSDSDTNLSIDERLKSVEREMVIEALVKEGGIQSRAAKLLGINERSVWHKIKKHGIDVKTIKKLQKM